MSEVDRICDAFRNSKMLKKPSSSDIYSYFHYYALKCVKDKRGDKKLAEKILKYFRESILEKFKGTMTLTFGEVAESHVGMQKLGKMGDRGFSYDELIKARDYFEKGGCKTLLLRLNDFLPENAEGEERKHLEIAKNNKTHQAWILVARNGIKCLTGDDEGKDILTEMLMFEWDTKLYNERRKAVQNKVARHNLNFDDEEQKANFEEGMGTTIPWSKVPILEEIKASLSNAFGEVADDLKCEGNMYYSYGKTGIGYHGDTERRKVIGLRLGKPIRIHYNWYYNTSPRGENISILLGEGDVYCMSEKTVGTDWKSAPKKNYTLRHAAGADKYTINTDKIKVTNRRVWNRDENVIIGDVELKTKKKTKQQIDQNELKTKKKQSNK